MLGSRVLDVLGLGLQRPDLPLLVSHLVLQLSDLLLSFRQLALCVLCHLRRLIDNLGLFARLCTNHHLFDDLTSCSNRTKQEQHVRSRCSPSLGRLNRQ
jgi:hypothetical protein